MKFNELIKAPDVTLNEIGAAYKIISAFNRAEIVFDVDGNDEKFHTVLKTNPLGKTDTVYEALKKHFQMEQDFFIIENVPFQELSPASVKIGAKVGVLFLSSAARFGGYGVILKQIEKPLTNKGRRLVNKDALLLSFPLPLVTANRRHRFRLHPQVEDYFVEISGYECRRDSPIQVFPIRNISDSGVSILMPGFQQKQLPEVDDILYIRLSLFLANKGYGLKRGVVVTPAEITEGKVTQQQFVLKSKVIHIEAPNDRSTEIAVQFLETAREGVSVDPKQFPHLTYLPVDQSEGIIPIFNWINKIQQIRRFEEKEKGLL
ncbi:MAG: hypothetical protein C4527_05275 [Candidatus Omnitrophota bacterium]|jgi:hypothetical protein|nr:MAG: hypothetical protein C4527_05275 [Candidatus Omnitrophota bacterium]